MPNIFDLVVDKHGPPAEARAVPPQILAKFASVLPYELIEFWKSYGIGLWNGGKFQLCLPSDYTEIVAAFASDDPVISPQKSHVIGFSAFGELLVWNESLERVLVDLPTGEVFSAKLGHQKTEAKISYPIATPLMGMDRSGMFDVFEDTDAAEPLFNRCKKKFGALRLGECFGFVPALRLGGRAKLENIQKLNAKIHFSILAGLGSFSLAVPNDDGLRIPIRSLGHDQP